MDQFNYDSFADRDHLSIDRWEWMDQSTISFQTRFDSTTVVVGTPSYTLRWRVVGASCYFQCTFVATTSIATTAGTDYMVLPITAAGYGGVATMVNRSTNIAVGTAVIDPVNNRVYLPTQVASGSTFVVSGWYEV